MKSALIPQLIDEFSGAVGAFSTASAGAYPGGGSSLPELRAAVHTLDGLDTDSIREAVHTGAGARRSRFGGIGQLLDLAIGIGGGLLSDRIGRDNDDHDRQLDGACALDEAAKECCDAIDSIESDSEIGLRELFLAATPVIEVLAMLLRMSPQGMLAGGILNAGVSIIEDTISTGMNTCRDRDTMVDKCLEEWIKRCENHCEDEESRPPKPEPDVATDCEPVPGLKDPNGGAEKGPVPAPEPLPEDCEETPEQPVHSEAGECLEKRPVIAETTLRLSACAVSTVTAQALVDVPADFTAELESTIDAPVTQEIVTDAATHMEECYEVAVAEVGPEPCVGTVGSAGFALLAIGAAALVESLECCCESVELPEPEPETEPVANLEDVPEPPPPPKENLGDVPEPPPPPKENLEDVPEPPPPPKENLGDVPEPPPPTEAAVAGEAAASGDDASPSSEDLRTRKAGAW